MEEKIKVIYYEDNVNLREGISFLIQSTPQLELLATFSNADTVKTDKEELKRNRCCCDRKSSFSKNTGDYAHGF
jgi:hypothetical protein